MKLLGQVKSNQNYLILIHDTENKTTQFTSFNENEFDFLLDTLNERQARKKDENKEDVLILENLKQINKAILLKDFLELSIEKQTYFLFQSKFIDFGKQ